MSVKAEARPNQNVKFLHCRYHDEQGRIDPNGGLTIAYVLDDKFKVVGFAAAKCHTNDPYVKRVGRMKAAGRLLSEHYYVDVPELDEQTFIKQTHDGFQEKFAAT